MRTIVTLFLLASFSVKAQAQDSTQVKPALIYFYRSTGMSGLGAYSAFIDDSLACHLNNNSYSIHSVAPGLHKLQAKVDGDKPSKKRQTLDLVMEPGKSYYVSMGVTNGMITSSLYLTEVTINTFKKMLPNLKEDTNCK